ncbi:thiamine biosynthesis protein ThiS [Pseudomonas taiwanensis]|uniref:MoaD/ThiS family protein n=1 Tax=Pseudomonas taiwanensis TaxID=470150 RepID=UPI0015BA4A21|nr:MoaD/ThiS family protein [Pseudomonas taiwanensis]NWL80611.1 thiamine biosynthesis protein ThiS [Pseudomonas taiwanensis]
MAHMSFTPNLQRHLDVPELDVTAVSVAEALEAAFVANPRLRSYLLDDQGRLRRHVAIFVDAQQVSDRRHLSDPVGPSSDIFVVQALSGG